MLRNTASSARSALRASTSKAASSRAFASEVSEFSAGPCFGLTEDQQAFRDLARDFTANEIIPVAAEHDRTMAYPWEVIRKAHAAGLMNTHIPEANGGPALDLISGALISEELAYGCTGIQTAIEANGLASAPLIVAGSEFLKQKYLGRLTEEPLMASYGVTEPGTGSDVASITTNAKKVGDKWILNGTKMWITNAGHANWFFVLAKTDATLAANKSMTGFIVEANWPGVSVGQKEINMGQRASDTRMVSFEDVEIPEENVIGSVGQGFKMAMGAFDITRPLIAAAATGVSARALHEATIYALDRKTFGVPIIKHQAVNTLLSEMAIATEASRLLTWKSAWTKDQGGRNTYFASMAKALASQTAVDNCSKAVQIYGGAGYNTGAPVEKLLRDSFIFKIYEGTTQIQNIIIGRTIEADKIASR